MKRSALVTLAVLAASGALAKHGGYYTYTSKGDAVYAIVLGWPGRTVTLKAPKATGATKVSLLGTSGPVRFSKTGGSLRIEIPENAAPGAYAYAFELTRVK
jgi:hypothetical protein